MASHSEELREAAALLVWREPGSSVEPSAARIRRSISTSYYALFHFLTEEAGLFLLGDGQQIVGRRNLLARSFTHRGVRAALAKVAGRAIDASVAPFFATAGGLPATPDFIRTVASAFIVAQDRRQDADYDLNAVLTTDDADVVNARVRTAMIFWSQATGPADRDFKHALCALMLLKGQLRRDEP